MPSYQRYFKIKMTRKKPPTKYTNNMDVKLDAKDQIDAINKISNLLTRARIRYWLGDIRTEKQVKKTIRDTLKRLYGRTDKK